MYDSQFKVFLLFLQFHDIDVSNVDVTVVLSFIEFLIYNGLSHNSIAAYVGAVKAKFLVYNLPIEMFQHQWVRMILKSTSRNLPACHRIKGILSIAELRKLVNICDSMHNGYVYKALFLLAFFAFLKLSNLVPSSINMYDKLRHLSRGDFIIVNNQAFVIIKWSKTLQAQSDHAVIQLPTLGSSELCPVKAIKCMMDKVPLPPHSPMFVLPCGGSHVCLTESKVRKTLKDIINHMGLDPLTLPFHSFRRSGASWAFANNVAIQEIQSHGTWSSEAVWRYIVTNPTNEKSVANTFQNLLYT